MERCIVFKVERQRVLVPVGVPCPFGCRYCYTRGGEVGPGRIGANDILARFQQFVLTTPTPFETIQFGYDGDPFASPERGIAMLRQLAQYGKHVNFSTKALLSTETLAALAEIRDNMQMQATMLSALVSLSCWDSAAAMEPHTPTPVERMQTVAALHALAIPTFIAVRPVLPHIADEEYERLFAAGVAAGCDGFILGPLYADDQGQFVRGIPEDALAVLPHQRVIVPWSAHAPCWLRYEDEARLHHLATLIHIHGGQVFLSSADAMALVSQERKAA